MVFAPPFSCLAPRSEGVDDSRSPVSDDPSDRRNFLRKGVAGLAAASMSLGCAQAASAVPPYRILMINFRGETDIERGFRRHMAYAGAAVDIRVRDTDRDVSRVAGILRHEAGFRPDIIITWGTGVTLAVTGTQDSPSRHALSDVPVVFAPVASPVQSGIVSRLSGHGRNLTGVVDVVPTEVQLRTMQTYLPFNCFGVIYSPAELNSPVVLDELRRFAGKSRIKLIERPLKLDAAGRAVGDGVEGMVADLRRQGAQWLYVPPDAFLIGLLPRVALAALAQRLPIFGATEPAAREGGALVGLVCRYSSVGQLAAVKALEILAKGRAASELPIETPKRFLLLVNMGMARSLGGLYPPLEMLNAAEFIDTPPSLKPTS